MGAQRLVGYLFKEMRGVRESSERQFREIEAILRAIQEELSKHGVLLEAHSTKIAALQTAVDQGNGLGGRNLIYLVLGVGGGLIALVTGSTDLLEKILALL